MTTRICGNGHYVHRTDVSACPVCDSTPLHVFNETTGQVEKGGESLGLHQAALTASTAPALDAETRMASPSSRESEKPAQVTPAEDTSRQRRAEREKAIALLRQCLVWGLMVSIFGTIMMAAGWPGAEVVDPESLSGEPDANGNWGIVFVGAVINIVGGCLLAVSLVGFGVKYGREAANV